MGNSGVIFNKGGMKKPSDLSNVRLLGYSSDLKGHMISYIAYKTKDKVMINGHYNYETGQYEEKM